LVNGLEVNLVILTVHNSTDASSHNMHTPDELISLTCSGWVQ